MPRRKPLSGIKPDVSRELAADARQRRKSDKTGVAISARLTSPLYEAVKQENTRRMVLRRAGEIGPDEPVSIGEIICAALAEWLPRNQKK